MPSGQFQKRPEILAPAGTEDAFAAALESGADAVYLGLSEGFNARARSTDFDLATLPTLVARAHAANVKLYLTLNTLIFESELPELERLVRGAIDSGVDALIVQDPATALLARSLSSKLRIHASTQMTISSVEGAAFALTLGVDRVVLPRELSTVEIAKFTQSSPLEAEVFVHGALCMSWSGQCLTSEAFSERSANRGQCSQACRMPYDAIIDGQKRELGDLRYLLSPEDLAGHEALPELMQAGVSSLKIEGRYKGPAYVTTAVDSWRNWRDALMRGVTDEDRARLSRDLERTQLTFSRGASLGFLHGENHQTLVVATTPKHRGLAAGAVQAVHGRSVTVALAAEHELREILRPGIGVKFELMGRSAKEHDPENAPGGSVFGVRWSRNDTVELSFGNPGPELSRVRAGDRVRVTADPAINREVERRIAQPVTGRIAVTLRVSGRAGEALRVRASALAGERSMAVDGQTQSVLEAARSGAGLNQALLAEKLGAFGGTPFCLHTVDNSELEPGLYVSVSELKQLRRDLVSQLESELARPSYEPLPMVAFVPQLRQRLSLANADAAGPAVLVPLCRTEEQLEAVIASAPAGTEVELDWMEMVGLGKAVKRARDAGLRVTLATVRVQKPGEEAYDRRIAGLAPDAVLVRHWGALMHFARAASQRDDGAPQLAVHGDFSLNVTNSLTALHLLGLGLATVTASHDLNKAQLLDLLVQVPRGRVACTLHHHISTFHNSHCVYARLLSKGKDFRDCGRPCEEHRIALRDYAGNEHPMVVDVGCRNTMFNASAQSAAPLVPRLLELGVRRFRVEFVWESADEVRRILEAYSRLLAGELGAPAVLDAVGVHERYGLGSLVRSRKR
jgi:putative protease